MTPSPADFLEFSLGVEGHIPCAGPPVTIEITGEAVAWVDRELIRQAAAGVLFFFREELKRTSISVGEFSAALETVLRGFGLEHIRAENEAGAGRASLTETDLCGLVGEGLEMVFFQRLRAELRRKLAPSPRVVRFHGLRSCVMRLAGARRWSARCQRLHDRIVDYLRCALQAEPGVNACGLVIH